MKKLKRIVASLLAVLMLLGVAPVTALAGEIELHRINTTQQPAEEPTQEPVLSSEDVLPEEDIAEAAEPAAVSSSSEFVRIFHLDCGRKYFSVSEIEGMIDQLAANHFTHIQLAFGNNGFRFLLNEMSITANGNTYDSESVKTAITGGNSSYSTGKGAASNMLTESDMDAIIAHAKEKGIEVIPMLNTPGHMDALVSAMVTLGIRSSTGSEMSLTSEEELNFIKALQKKYIDYFAGKGSTRYNFAADEYSFDKLDNNGYTAFAQYVNDTAAMIKGAGMIPMCYNDGINYSGKTTSVSFDKDIEICYWAQATNYASVTDLANAGFKIVNNNDAWYYVLGDYLYSIWSNGQWGYEDALKGIKGTPVTQAKNASDGAIPLVGSVLCCWCDGPYIGYTDKGVNKGTASARTQTNQESVYKLIKAMADANPDYFKAEENPKEPEIVVSPATGEVQAEKLENGHYKVAVKPNDTLTLTLSNSTAKLNWASDNAEVAAVADGKVTFTGKAGTVTITAEPAATRNDASAKAPYSITFEVEERGTTSKTIMLKVGQTKPETIVGNNYVNNVDRSELKESIATVDVVGKDEVAGSVIYKEETKTISALAGTSTTWTKTNYYHKVGENYYPVYGKRLSEVFILWTTYTYYYGYSENDNSDNVTEISSSENSNATVIVYTKSGTEAVPASTTITFKGVSKGTTYVTVGDIRYTIEVSEKTALTVDGVEIPITIVDYRADGLLFDWTYNPDTSYSDSYRYGLVHGKVTKWGSSGTGVTATLNSGTGLYEVNGTHNSVEQIEGTVIQNTNAESTATTFYSNSTDNSWSRAGLVKEELGANGSPVYTEATVKYVAGLLKAGYYNKITKSGNSIIYDTFVSDTGARTIRNTSATEMSTAFSGSRTWDNITNAYDLAWYLLNYLYTPDTNLTMVTGTDGVSHEVPIYGMGVDEYSKIILKQTADGTYRFDASKNKTKYDTENGAIYEDDSASSGMFYPLEDLGYEQPGLLKNTSEVDGNGRNGNFTLRGESQFIYNEADNLYFQFKGDDDVYMFINGVLALDLGGSHGSNTKKVELNKLNKTKYNLEDGKIATFTFFYMERCSDASTFAIETNMKLTKRAIEVEKKGYDSSYSADVASGAIVENGKSVAYDLIVTNKGDVTMSNIKFEDTDTHGASMAFGYGVETPHFTPVTSSDFTLSLLPGYRLYKTDANGNIIEGSDVRGLTVDELSTAVAVVNLEKNQSLHIRYIKADVTIREATMAQYTNMVKVTAESGGQTLTDSAIHEIYSYNVNDTEKSYVVDFGLPLEINKIFDPSSHGFFDNPNAPLTLNKNCEIKYGNLVIEGAGPNTVLKYTLKEHTTIDNVETIILDVVYKLGNNKINLQKNIRIIPASTVYYEDDLVKFKNSDGTSVVATAPGAVGTWHTVGTKKTDVTQALDRLGGENVNVYGYDPAYADCSEYSLGSATKVTVNASLGEHTPTATFTFKGTGFDIISLTDNNSGAIVVNVKGKEAGNESYNKNFLVNNYYGYKRNENGTWEVVHSEAENALYQIPVIKVSGLSYGKYEVTISVAYNTFFDKTGDNEYSFWLDALRIYNPTGIPATNLDYMKDKEGYPQFIKLRDAVKAGITGAGALFIDGAENATITEYKNFGPNNEVYLAKGQAISFKLDIPAGTQIASVQIGAKAPNGSANLVVNGGEPKAIATATEMYYKISKNTDNSITIANTGTGILSLTNLKVTYSTEGSVSLVPMNAEEQTSAVMMVRAMFAPPAPTVFEPETFTVSLKNYKDVYVREYIKVTVTTSDDVKYITVGDKRISRYDDERVWGGFRKGFVKTGKRVWSYYVSFDTAGQQVISVVAYDADGLASEAVENTVNVKPRSAWRGKTSEWHI